MRTLPRALAVCRDLLTGDRALNGIVQGLVVQGCVQGLNILTGVLTARLLGPEGRGVFVVLSLWPGFLSAVAMAGMSNALTFHLQQRGDRHDAALPASLALATLVALIAAGAGQFLIPLALPDWPHEVVAGTMTLTWFVLLNGLMVVCRPMLLARGDYVAFHLMYIAPPATYLCALLLVAGILGLTPMRAAICLFSSGIPSAAFAAFLIIKRSGISLKGGLSWASCLSGSALLAFPGEAVVAVFSFADRLILANLVSAKELGLYSVAASLSGMLYIVSLGANQILLRTMSKATNTQRALIHDHAVRLGFWCIAALALIMLAVGGFMIEVAFGRDFAAAVPVFRLLLIAATLSCVAQIANQTVLSLGRPEITSAVEFLGTAVTIAGIFLATPVYGTIGTAGAIIVGSAIRLCFILSYLNFAWGLRLTALLPQRSDVQFALSTIR